jgi:hypothetical protein
MARLFTPEQKALLRAPSLDLHILMTFYLDEGTYRFCDDIVDVSDGVNTWIGANPLAGSFEIRSGRDLAAEPITLQLDGAKMTQAGIANPARVLRDIMGYLHSQRRVDVAFGFSYPDQAQINLIVPMAAMKINHCRLIDPGFSLDEANQEQETILEIVMDSLAMRYARTTWRTRSHADQIEIDPTDMFFSFTADAANTEMTLYWGRASLNGGSTYNSIGNGTAANMGPTSTVNTN